MADDIGFSAYPVESVYRGKPKTPDFAARDKAFSLFKTLILAGMKGGSTFAGEYSVIQFGCGASCTTVVVANNRTGELFDFPRGGETNQGLEVKFDLKSKLMLARWYTDTSWEGCIFESLLFQNGEWIAKTAVASGTAGPSGGCDGDILERVKKKMQ
ncbi:hypothetical protein J2X76_004777 [Neorhizobium sp. 2083]|uniref:hypothetical protein n=1 Tax=Neorhizobium sp. 2083 TaxID=2817762 RepID=UPI0028569349|nr:hypothetical protein [Neorhizobium sp. 2083]MDR6819585.1 hypothetical protein [Neorhizobium sp. 2083]